MIEPIEVVSQAVQYCRTCNHTYGWHVRGGERCMYDLNKYFKNNCKCEEYITSDNLRYLEWKYEQNKK